MLRAHKTFEDLGTFTLARGLREIRRVQLSKEEQARKGDTKGKSRASGDLESGEEPSTEKARLLESEATSRRESSEVNPDLPLSSGDSPQRELSLDDEAPRPLASPVTGPAPEDVPSEKARGKMRERSSISVEMTRSLERIAQAGIGRNRFVPTQEWVTSWQQGCVLQVQTIFFLLLRQIASRLPLDPVMLVISELIPKVHDLQASLNKANTTPAIVDFLASADLSHVLPHPPAITPRRFVVSLGDYSSGQAARLTISTLLVVRRVDNMVSFPHMGGGVRTRHDTAGYLEWDKGPFVLCQTFPGARERSDYRDGDKCDWWTVGKRWSRSKWRRSRTSPK